ncbi:hypothetical protein D3C75_831230 [compost metagenome]
MPSPSSAASRPASLTVSAAFPLYSPCHFRTSRSGDPAAVTSDPTAANSSNDCGNAAGSDEEGAAADAAALPWSAPLRNPASKSTSIHMQRISSIILPFPCPRFSNPILHLPLIQSSNLLDRITNFERGYTPETRICNTQEHPAKFRKVPLP